MAKQKYYTLTNILKEKCEYNVLLGERSNGKSYSVKHHCLNEFMKHGNGFIYLRRLTVEIKNSMVEAYFNDVDVSKVTKGKYSLITVYRSGIWLCNWNEKGQIVREAQCGMVMALSTAGHYKSMSLLQYTNVIFEEFITDQLYLPDEPNMLQQLISTVARRNRITVFLIGNTISRLCPYFNEWQLFNIPNQKQGTIEIYHMDTNQKEEDGTRIIVNIAVELCENSGDNSKMFFGTISKSITSGSWESESQPHIPYDYNDCEKLYALTVIRYNMFYVAELLRYENEMFIFVHPTKRIRTSRVIQEDYNPNMLYTHKLVELTRGDVLMRKLIRLNKICYSDNLTGSEFKNNILPSI